MVRVARAIAVLIGLACAVAAPASATAEAGRTGWEEHPPPPFRLEDAQLRWTGRTLLLLGSRPTGPQEPGQFRRRFGPELLALAPGAGRWRALPRPPGAARAQPAVAWTGEQLLVWGGADLNNDHRALDTGVAYEPAARRWTPLPAAPLSARIPAVAAWTGRELIVWGDANRFFRVRDGAAYDPERRAWRVLPDAPYALNQAEAVWTGRELVVVGSALDGNNNADTRGARALSYDPNRDSWRALPSPGLSPQASSVAWMGDFALAWDYELSASSYRDGEWEAAPPLPLRFYECYPRSATLATVVLAWYCGRGATFQPAERRWRRVPRPPCDCYLGDPVAAGTRAFLLGSTAGGTKPLLYSYTPPG